MRRTLTILSALVAFFILSSTSCEEPEPYVQIKEIEKPVLFKDTKRKDQILYKFELNFGVKTVFDH